MTLAVDRPIQPMPICPIEHRIDHVCVTRGINPARGQRATIYFYWGISNFFSWSWKRNRWCHFERLS